MLSCRFVAARTAKLQHARAIAAAQPPNVTSKLWLIPWVELCPVWRTDDLSIPLCKGEKSVVVLLNPNAIDARAAVCYLRKSGAYVTRAGYRVPLAPGGSRSYVGEVRADVRDLTRDE